MLNTARKYNVSFAAVTLSKMLKLALPIWYHLGALKKMRLLENTCLGDCLRDRHQVRIVADLIPLLQAHSSHEHLPNPQPTTCHCTLCSTALSQGCKNPCSCFTAAWKLSNLIKPKWDPELNMVDDGLTLTLTRNAQRTTAMEEGGDVLFDPTLTE